jgi:hypothetical protein
VKTANKKPGEGLHQKAELRDADFSSISGRRLQPLYDWEDRSSFDAAEDLGAPGEYPYTRGIHPTMYRGRLWTMRQFAGMGTPAQTNQRYKFLLDKPVYRSPLTIRRFTAGIPITPRRSGKSVKRESPWIRWPTWNACFTISPWIKSRPP